MPVVIPSPLFSIDSNPVGEKASIAAGTSFSATIDDITGVAPVTWEIATTDDTTLTTDYVATFVQSGSVGQTITMTSLAAGTAAELKCTVAGGTDPSISASSARMVATAKFYVPTAAGLEVLSAGEVGSESSIGSPTHGAVEAINAIIRGGGGGLGDWKESVRFATTAPLEAHSGTGTLTRTGNGAFPATDGVAPALLDRLLAKDEAATDTEHGMYFIADLGSGATPWIITRVLDADGNAEVTAGLTVHVEEGTVSGGVKYELVQTGAIVVDTTALSFVVHGSVSGTGTDRAVMSWDALGTGARDNPNVKITSGGDVQFQAGSLELQTSAGHNIAGATAGSDAVLGDVNLDTTTLGDAIVVNGGSTVDLQIGGTSSVLVDGLTVKLGQPVEVNTDAGPVPGAGSLRLPGGSALGLRFIAPVGGGTIIGVVCDDSDNIIVGDATNTDKVWNVASLSVEQYVGGAQRYTITPTTATFNVPVLWAAVTATPSLSQADGTGAGDTGETLLIHPQDETGGGGSTGGAFDLRPGDGDTGGQLALQDGAGNDVLTVDDDGIVKAVNELTVAGLRVLPYTVDGTVAAPLSGAQAPDIGDFLPYDPTGGAGVVTLPAISAGNKGQSITLKNVTDNGDVVTYNTNGGNTMDGVASGAFTTFGKRHLQVFVSDGDDEWMLAPGAP